MKVNFLKAGNTVLGWFVVKSSRQLMFLAVDRAHTRECDANDEDGDSDNNDVPHVPTVNRMGRDPPHCRCFLIRQLTVVVYGS